MNNQQFKEMNEKVDKFQLVYFEKERECQVLANELHIKEQSFQQERQALAEEIASLKEREDLLKRQMDILQKHLDVQKTSSLATDQSSPDQSLLLQERLDRAISDLENVRAQYQTLLQATQELQSRLNSSEYARIQMEEKLRESTEQNVYRGFQLRHFEEVNEQNRTLIEEKRAMGEEIEKIKVQPRIQEKVHEEVQKHIEELANELKIFKEKNEQLRREVQKREPGEMQQEQPPVFKEMYRSLQKAKQILVALIELLGINDDENIAGSVLGKRQRTQ